MNLETSSQFHQKTLSSPAVAGRNLSSFLYLAEIPCRGYGCQPWATPWVIVRTPIGRLVKAKESLPRITQIYTNIYQRDDTEFKLFSFLAERFICLPQTPQTSTEFSLTECYYLTQKARNTQTLLHRFTRAFRMRQ